MKEPLSGLIKTYLKRLISRRINKLEADMTHAKDLRKNYFINKDFQSKFILEFCTLIVAGTIVLGSFVFLYIYFNTI